MATPLPTGQECPKSGLYLALRFIDPKCPLKLSHDERLTFINQGHTIPCTRSTKQPAFWILVDDLGKNWKPDWEESHSPTKAQLHPPCKEELPSNLLDFQRKMQPPSRSVERDRLSEAIEERRRSLFATTSQPDSHQPSRQPVRRVVLDATTVELTRLCRSVIDPISRDVLREAIGAYHNHHYRNAILLSWQAAIALLHKEVCDHHLEKLNELLAKEGNAKPVQSRNGLTKIREGEFLFLLTKIEVIDKALQSILLDCLERRNQACHPNGVQFGRIAVAYHLEMLILSVFNQFVTSH